ncbi:MAG: hypothetical protein AB7V39_03400 [Nitrospiraceae bacterium]
MAVVLPEEAVDLVIGVEVATTVTGLTDVRADHTAIVTRDVVANRHKSLLSRQASLPQETVPSCLWQERRLGALA